MAQLQGVFAECPAPALTAPARRPIRRRHAAAGRPRRLAPRRCSIRRHRPAGARLRRLAALGLAPAHEHAHRARAAAAARDRGGARLARAAAQRRPERRHAVLRRQPRPRAGARQPAAVRRLHVGRGSRRSTSCCSSRSSAASSRARKHHWKALRARPPRTPARLERLADHRESIVELAPGRRCREPPPTTAIDLAADQLKRGGLPGRALRLARRRCRSRPSAATCARPATSSSTRRSSACSWRSASAAGFTYTGQRVDHRGPHVRQHAARLRLVQPRALRRRGDAHARTR